MLIKLRINIIIILLLFLLLLLLIAIIATSIIVFTIIAVIISIFTSFVAISSIVIIGIIIVHSRGRTSNGLLAEVLIQLDTAAFGKGARGRKHGNPVSKALGFRVSRV